MIRYLLAVNEAANNIELVAYESNDLWNGTTNTNQHLTVSGITYPCYDEVFDTPCHAEMMDVINEKYSDYKLFDNSDLAFVYGYNKIKYTVNHRLNNIYKDVKLKFNVVPIHVNWGTMDDFRNHQRSKALVIEKFMLRLESVEKHSDGYTFHYKNGGGLRIWKDGNKQTYNIAGKWGKKDQDLFWKDQQVHYRYQYNGCTIFIEKLVILAECFLNDWIPLDLRALHANVMDASGNPETAEKLGTPVNLSPSNIEFTWQFENMAHYRTVISLYEMFGHVYKVSANDYCLYELARNGSKEEIAWYINLVQLPIVK